MTTLKALKTLAKMGWERRAPELYCLQPEKHKERYLVRFPCDDPYCVADICAACLEELMGDE